MRSSVHWPAKVTLSVVAVILVAVVARDRSAEHKRQKTARPAVVRSETQSSGTAAFKTPAKSVVVAATAATVAAATREVTTATEHVTSAVVAVEAQPDAANDPKHPYLSEDMLTLDDTYDPEVAFTTAGTESGVPPDLLKAVAYLETRGEHKHGVRQPDGGFGVMKLRETSGVSTLSEAAELLKVDKSVLVRDPVQNIRGAAAVLRAYHDDAMRNGSANPWIIALSMYTGRSAEEGVNFSREVDNILAEGLAATSGSVHIVIKAHEQLLLEPAP